MPEIERAGYRSRLEIGQVVYFAEGPDPYLPEKGAPIAKKATILEDCSNRRYAVIRRWDATDVEPPKTGLGTTISPRRLFTAIEVARELNKRQEASHLAIADLDAIVQNPETSLELAIVLSGAALIRMADDLVRNPDDPEY